MLKKFINYLNLITAFGMSLAHRASQTHSGCSWEIITDQQCFQLALQRRVICFLGKESLATWVCDAMPFGLRAKELSSYLFTLTQLAMESLGGKVVLRHSSLLLSRKYLGKWRETGREINLMGNHL